MKTLSVFSVLLFALAVCMTSCGPKDLDIQKTVQTNLSAMPEAVNVAVTVIDGEVTLTGNVTDDATKAIVESSVAGIKNVKSVVNNLEIVAPTPDFTELDSIITSSLTDALKDHSTVSATVKEGVITLTGDIKKTELPILMQKLSALNPVKIDNTSLTVK
ncbi:MAG: BON domain-containing protein [Dysgonamonadaceae bacterium]